MRRDKFFSLILKASSVYLLVVFGLFLSYAALPASAQSYSIWDASAIPTYTAVSDGQAIEIGVKFRSNVDGYITGIRFYKGSANTGTHVGNLWSTTGTLLASATFASEMESGWQEVLFSLPVPITANTTYVAAYHSASGYFAFDQGYFTAGVDNGPLRALAEGEDGPNGVYKYGGSGFPTDSYNSSNYWVDVVFKTSLAPDTTPPSAPLNLAAMAFNSRQIDLSWSASVDNDRIAGYKVERCQGDGCGDFIEIDTTAGTGTTYSNIGLQTSTSYSYRVRAIDAAGNTSPYSNTDSASTLTPGNRDSLVLVNHLSANFEDFEHFIKPYLDNFGIAYSVLDIAATDLYADVGDYAVIIIGHRRLDVGATKYLDPTEQDHISAAVSAGTGLINFDNDLFTDSGTSRYTFIQNIFGFGFQAPGLYSGVSFPTPASHYITERHQVGEIIDTEAMTLADITLPSGVTSLATTGGRPFLSVTRHGSGYAVQWGTYEWMSHYVKGPLMGLDDLVWRSIVWTARKPFAMQGMPPFVTMRMDDVSDPLQWIPIANDYGFIPWAGVFTDDIDATEAAGLSDLVNSGSATVAMHAFGTNNFFYFDHFNRTNFDSSTIADHYAEATNWFNTRQIPISKYVVPHYYEIGSNAFSGLEDWGAEFIGTMMDPGEMEDSAPWMMKGPYRLYETGSAFERNSNPYYADFMNIPGHPEMDEKFFNCVTEIRDVTGYEWLGNRRNTVAYGINDGTEWLKRAFDSMVLATLFSHEYTFIDSLSQADWQSILQGITQNIAAYDPIYVSLDYACQYVRAMHTSDITGADYDPDTQQFMVTLGGYTDLPTKFYLFNEVDGVIQESLVDVPTFNGSAQVVVNVTVTHDTTPPSVNLTTPIPEAIDVSIGTTVTATFSEAMDAASINAGTFELRDGSNGLVSSTITYNVATYTATLDPTVALDPNATYTVTVIGGAGGVSDLAGNPLSTDYSWSFTTSTGNQEYSLWNSSTIPAALDIYDGQSLEIGVKFVSDTAGYINGLRFYKGPADTGTHIGHLWTGDGTLLASATFTGEAASGWQEVTFSAPVPIAANTTYVASYYSPSGYHAEDEYYFISGVISGPLRALFDGEDGGNGVYRFGASGFPDQTFNATNYWVDVTFEESILTGDFDSDCDVDGLDLVELLEDISKMSPSAFAQNFGIAACQ